jgi:hypothetical protein
MPSHVIASLSEKAYETELTAEISGVVWEPHIAAGNDR